MNNCRVLSQTASNEQKAMVFTTVFVIVWVGSIVITINTLLLGGKVYVLLMILMMNKF